MTEFEKLPKSAQSFALSEAGMIDDAVEGEIPEYDLHKIFDTTGDPDVLRVSEENAAFDLAVGFFFGAAAAIEVEPAALFLSTLHELDERRKRATPPGPTPPSPIATEG